MVHGADKPQTVNLLPLLESIFADEEKDPDVSELKNILLALIEDGNRHTWHSHRDGPVWGLDPCARKVKKKGGAEVVYCRYLFPRDLFIEALHDGQKGEVRADPHRTNLQNLFLTRNDTLINNFEEHLLLMNVGNIDWRPLINLWSVLEYLTKYTSKVGKATKHLGKLFGDVVATVCQFEEEDGVHDLWRRTIMKFYNRLLGNRDYSLFEVVHFGLRLPGTLSSFGPVESVSVSNWSSVKRGTSLRGLPKGERLTHLSKLEIFNARCELERPDSIPVQALENISFYCFWRLFYNNKNKLVKRRREKVLALNGTGWPAQAKRGHVHHEDYAKRTLYAYMPCAGLQGTEYVDDYGAALEAFVQDPLQKWCPTWIKRNYETLNQVDLTAGISTALQATLNTKVRFMETMQEVKTESDETVGADGSALEPKAALREEAEQWSKAIASGEPPVPEDHAAPEAYDTDHHWDKERRPPEELHSALGPNLEPAPKQRKVEALDDTVNPEDHDWHTAWKDVDVQKLRAAWEALREEKPELDVGKRENFELHDFQQLFVTLVLRHAEEVVAAWKRIKYASRFGY